MMAVCFCVCTLTSSVFKIQAFDAGAPIGHARLIRLTCTWVCMKLACVSKVLLYVDSG